MGISSPRHHTEQEILEETTRLPAIFQSLSQVSMWLERGLGGLAGQVVVTPTQEFPELTTAPGQLTRTHSTKNWQRRPTRPALTKQEPLAQCSQLGSQPLQGPGWPWQDAEEEAKSADAEAEDRTGKGKSRLEKAAQLENK